MRSLLFLIALSLLVSPVFSQNVYTITADSVKLTSCDSSELIIMNHTQNVPGFLFNTGNGRTIFQRGASQLGNGMYLVGADTIKTPSNAWLQGGNSFGTTGVLGTLDNNHLDLYTNDTGRARLTNTGNLLLGTTTDGGQILQVNGNSYFNGSPLINLGGNTIDFISPVPTFSSFIRFTNGSNNHQLLLGSGTGVYTDILGIGYSTSNPAVQPFVTFGPNLTTFGTNEADYSVFFAGPYYSSYNLTYPGSLTVGGGYNGGGFGPKLDFSVGDQFLGNPVIGGGIFMIKTNLGGSNANNLSTQMSFHLRQDSVDVGEIMSLRSDGDVLIGTTTDNGYKLQVNGGVLVDSSVRFAGLTVDSTQPNVVVSDASGNLYLRSVSSLAANDIIRSSLAVNGPIKAQRLTLSQANWPDYVFDSSYRLPPLSDIENYIRQQHHLPGVAAAAEVQKDGTDVGNTQAVLLKKIEELTLYTIEQKHEIELLKKEMDALRQLITSQPGNR